MAIVEEVIRLESDNTLSFGNYIVKEKQKVTDFDVKGDLYKVRTHKDVTRLSKNSKLLLETVPGATVHNLSVKEKSTTFTIEGYEDTLVTLELEPETSYSIYVDDVNIDKVKTNLTGKVGFSVDLKSEPQKVRIEKH
ncbi:MAG: endosialidase [Firmicutes bacterium]|nr:endosialidase [Bacillota bacterium]